MVSGATPETTRRRRVLPTISDDDWSWFRIVLCAAVKANEFSFDSGNQTLLVPKGGVPRRPVLKILGLVQLVPPRFTRKASSVMRWRVMECFTVQNGLIPRHPAPKIFFAVNFGLNFPPGISTFGNSQRCAFTTPAGRWRTRKRPFLSITKATKHLAVAASRLPKFGKSSTRFSRKATQSFLTGQTGHFGWRGVQMSAPSSMRD